MNDSMETIFVTGGAGYVGAALVPALLKAGYRVKVLDLYMYGDDVLASVKGDPNLEEIKGDMRDVALLRRVVPGSDAVIHLACISNDPSFELDPGLGKSINYDAFIDLVKVSKDSGVKRFIYASSSSVYGIKKEPNVHEDLPLEPLTDYSKYKAMCEEVLMKERTPDFTTFIVRPSTVCGYSRRLRLDVVVNILTNNAVNTGKIKVFGGSQMRPNLHIDDMVRLYVEALGWPAEKIDGRIYNVGYHNFTVREIADKVRTVVGPEIEIITTPTDDNRSYHVSSERIKRDLGFAAVRSLEDAVQDLQNAFRSNLIPNSMTDDRYYNIRRMQRLKLR